LSRLNQKKRKKKPARVRCPLESKGLGGGAAREQKVYLRYGKYKKEDSGLIVEWSVPSRILVKEDQKPRRKGRGSKRYRLKKNLLTLKVFLRQ